MKKRYFLLLLCILTLSLNACKGNAKEEKKAVSGGDGKPTQDELDYGAYVEEEIDVSSLIGSGFLCNNGVVEALNTEYDETTKETKISLKALSETNVWIDEGKNWILRDSYTVDYLNYGKDGALYGLTYQMWTGGDEEAYAKQMQSYRISRFLDDGTIEEVPLKDMMNSSKNRFGDVLSDSKNQTEDWSGIASFQVFRDHTILICYLNDWYKLYDMESGEKIAAYDSVYQFHNKLWSKNAVVTEDEIICASAKMEANKEFDLLYIDKREGTITEKKYRNEVLGSGNIWIAGDDGEDVYLHTENGLFLAEKDSNQIKRLADSNRIKTENNDYCYFFCVGAKDDFYMAYYEGFDEDDPNPEVVHHMVHYY